MDLRLSLSGAIMVVEKDWLDKKKKIFKVLSNKKTQELTVHRRSSQDEKKYLWG